jgi:hypothetical protein
MSEDLLLGGDMLELFKVNHVLLGASLRDD